MQVLHSTLYRSKRVITAIHLREPHPNSHDVLIFYPHHAEKVHIKNGVIQPNGETFYLDTNIKWAFPLSKKILFIDESNKCFITETKNMLKPIASFLKIPSSSKIISAAVARNFHFACLATEDVCYILSLDNFDFMVTSISGSKILDVFPSDQDTAFLISTSNGQVYLNTSLDITPIDSSTIPIKTSSNYTQKGDVCFQTPDKVLHFGNHTAEMDYIYQKIILLSSNLLFCIRENNTDIISLNKQWKFNCPQTITYEIPIGIIPSTNHLIRASPKSFSIFPKDSFDFKTYEMQVPPGGKLYSLDGVVVYSTDVETLPIIANPEYHISDSPTVGLVKLKDHIYQIQYNAITQIDGSESHVFERILKTSTFNENCFIVTNNLTEVHTFFDDISQSQSFGIDLPSTSDVSAIAVHPSAIVAACYDNDDSRKGGLLAFFTHDSEELCPDIHLPYRITSMCFGDGCLYAGTAAGAVVKWIFNESGVGPNPENIFVGKGESTIFYFEDGLLIHSGDEVVFYQDGQIFKSSIICKTIVPHGDSEVVYVTADGGVHLAVFDDTLIAPEFIHHQADTEDSIVELKEGIALHSTDEECWLSYTGKSPSSRIRQKAIGFDVILTKTALFSVIVTGKGLYVYECVDEMFKILYSVSVKGITAIGHRRHKMAIAFKQYIRMAKIDQKQITLLDSRFPLKSPARQIISNNNYIWCFSDDEMIVFTFNSSFDSFSVVSEGKHNGFNSVCIIDEVTCAIANDFSLNFVRIPKDFAIGLATLRNGYLENVCSLSLQSPITSMTVAGKDLIYCDQDGEIHLLHPISDTLTFKYLSQVQAKIRKEKYPEFRGISKKESVETPGFVDANLILSEDPEYGTEYYKAQFIVRRYQQRSSLLYTI